MFPDTTQIDSSGTLNIGGCNTLDLANEYGTPLYVFDEDTIRNRCRSFVQEFQKRVPETQVVYASKAYINPVLVRMLAEESLGLDVVSGGELAVAIAGGLSPTQAYFHGNNKTPQELREAVQQGIGRIVVDSFQ